MIDFVHYNKTKSFAYNEKNNYNVEPLKANVILTKGTGSIFMELNRT